MDFRVSLLLLSLAVVVVSGQRKRPVKEEWDYRDGSEKVSMKGVANLTTVLDDWRFDILNQVKNLLQNDHQSLLPDYSRIKTLSEALDDLYKEFNALKAHLADLTEKFGPIETFIDELKTKKAEGAASGPAAGSAAGGVVRAAAPDAAGGAAVGANAAVGSTPQRRRFYPKKKSPPTS